MAIRSYEDRHNAYYAMIGRRILSESFKKNVVSKSKTPGSLVFSSSLNEDFEKTLQGVILSNIDCKITIRWQDGTVKTYSTVHDNDYSELKEIKKTIIKGFNDD